MNILAQLQDRFREALAAMAGERLSPAELTELADMVRPSQDPKFGDYQANCAMPLAKKLGRPPREIAADLVGRLDIARMCEPLEIAGPGFINLRLRTDWLTEQLTTAAADERLGIERVAKPRTIVIDYSAPNVAKPMHVGHIRSTVIGDSLYRTLKFLGHTVVSDNHIGDWGTQFGMILYGRKVFPNVGDQYQVVVGDLLKTYREMNRLIKQEPELASLAEDPKEIADKAKTAEKYLQGALAETAKLHSDDDETLKKWRTIVSVCLKEIDRIYHRLGVRFDETLGESFYRHQLSDVVQELISRGIAQFSQRAVGVFFDDEPESPPFLVQKQDGAFLYATTDLATIQYRIERWHPDAILYVVDSRQSLHFQQLFKTARKWLRIPDLELAHISFGTVLGDDGRPFKTRSGDTVGLESLLDEAIERALVIVSANDDSKPGGPELSPADRQRVAEVVGIGALKYADLSQNRASDYVFSYDKMLAMNGNTATYMQYAHARVRSIFAKGQLQAQETAAAGSGALNLAHPAERVLGLELLRFSESLQAVVRDYRPNHLTNYLFELANSYSTFYEQCPVLKADTPEQRESRLALCDLTARTLRQGLALLGIEVVDKM